MGSADKILSIGSSIVFVALVTTVVIHPASAQVINAIGGSFSQSLKAAMGR